MGKYDHAAFWRTFVLKMNSSVLTEIFIIQLISLLLVFTRLFMAEFLSNAELIKLTLESDLM